jgi:hypothetical protein
MLGWDMEGFQPWPDGYASTRFGFCAGRFFLLEFKTQS